MRNLYIFHSNPYYLNKSKFFIFSIAVILCCTNIFSQWQPDVRLTYDPAESHTSYMNAWCIAASGDTVHVVWYDNRVGLDDIFYKRSTDKGITWGPDTRISFGTSWSQYPSVFATGQVVHVVWQDWRNPSWEIYYKRSTDGGTTWGTDTRLTNDPGNSWNSTVIASGSLVHTFWEDSRDGNMEIYYKRSTDQGTTWGSDIRLTNNSADSWIPSCAVSGTSVHVLWSDIRDGNYEVYYKRSTDGGISWGTDTRLTNNTWWSGNPTIAISGSVIHVIFEDDRNGGSSGADVYYMRSTDLGLTWGPDTRLTTDPNRSEYASVAASGQNVHVLWYDDRDGNHEIYYKRSTNGGLNWEADLRLTNAAGSSEEPSMALSGTIVHCVWMDYRDGNYEIYYKRNPTGNSLPQAPPAPILVSPPNGSYNQPSTVRFIWNKSFSALTYRLQVALDSSFTNLVVNDSTLTDSTIVVTNLLVNRYYWWRVNAKNVIGTSLYSSVWRFGTFFVGLNQIGTEIPKEYKLFNNYPNPFNPATKIKFNIPALLRRGAGVVLLKVYDILGRKVNTLVNEKLKPGTYEVEFDGSNYASGVYYYKLETDYYVKTKKMVLIK